MDIFNKIEDPIIVFELKGHDLASVIEVNEKALYLLKYSREEILKLKPDEIISNIDRKKIPSLIRTLERESSFIYELHFKDKSGFDLLFNLDIHLTRFDNKKVLFVIAKNAAEIEPAENYIRFAKVIENTDAAVITLDLDKIVKTANRSSVEMLGEGSIITGMPFVSFIHKKEKLRFNEMIKQIYKGARISRFEIECITLTGKSIYLALTVSPIRDIDDKILGYSIIARDVSERVNADKELKQSRKQLRELARHIDDVREQERKSIAADVHDILGQNLTALKLDTLWLKKKLQNNEEDYSGRLDDMYGLIEITAEHIHRISAQLRPPGLDHLGLIPAIEYQLQEVKKRMGINYHLACEPANIIVKEPIATPLFRIFQELMTNIMRHSKARNVDVSITKIEKLLIMKVRDDGIGMTHDKMNNPKAFGLLGMKERALSIGGSVEITSRLNLGATIKVFAPLEEV